MFGWLKKLLPTKKEISVDRKPIEGEGASSSKTSAVTRIENAVTQRPVSPARDARVRPAGTVSEVSERKDPEKDDSGYQIRGSKIATRTIKFSDAQTEWQKARTQVRGQLIMLVAGGPHLQVIEDESNGSPEQVLQEAMTIDAAEFLIARKNSLAPDQQQATIHQIARPEHVRAAAPPLTHFISFMNVNKNRNSPTVEFAVISCDAPWKVFAWLPFGNWNDVPNDSQLTAVFRRWFEKFGAVPAVVSSDVIEFWIDQPITDSVVASELAMEMFYLCPDIVDQGTETVENLASSLLNANVWYFWWD
jgi:hypothetical protein